MKTNIIYNEDVLDAFKRLPDKSVDLIILDPPYWKVVNEKWDFQWRTENDYANWCKKWITECSRVIKLSGTVYIFGYLRNLFYLHDAFLEHNFLFRQQIIVDKGIRSIGGRATKNYKIFPNTTETILFYIKDSKAFIKKFLKEKQLEKKISAKQMNILLGAKENGGGLWSLYTGNNILAQVPTKEMWGRLEEILDFKLDYNNISQTFNIEMGVTDVWSDINFYSEERHHPTQKPLKLIERLIRASTNVDMVVLDPFFGAGSTGIACKKLNRRYIGFEIDENFYKIATRRIDDEVLGLFNTEKAETVILNPSISELNFNHSDSFQNVLNTVNQI